MSAVAPAAIDLKGARWHQALGKLAAEHYWLCFGAVLALLSWNSFWRLGDTLVRDHDEGRYGVAASEMLHSTSMLITTYAGETEFWNLKPLCSAKIGTAADQSIAETVWDSYGIMPAC